VALPKRRTAPSKQGSRRSHHRLWVPQLVTCARCRSAHQNHRPCPVCGNYNGRDALGLSEDRERAEE